MRSTVPRVSRARLRVEDALPVGLSLVAVFVLLWRIQYGIDLHDEASYAAIALRFAQGARPLADYLDSHQFSAFLLSPYVRLHLWLFGREGLVLGLRVLFALATIGCASLATAAYRPLIGWHLALPVAFSSVVAVPFLIPALSYNTMAGLVVSASISLALMAHGDGGASPRNAFLVGAGMAAGIAAVCYPTLVLGIALVPAAYWMVSGQRSSAVVVAVGVGLGLLIAGLPFLPHVHSLSAFVAYSRGFLDSGFVGGSAKLAILGAEAWRALAHAPAFWIAVGISARSVAKGAIPRWVWVVFIGALPLSQMDVAWANRVAFVAVVSMTVLHLSGALKPAREVTLVWGLAVCWVLGLIAAYSSGTNVYAFGALAWSAPGICVVLALRMVSAGEHLKVGQARPGLRAGGGGAAGTVWVVTTTLAVGLLAMMGAYTLATSAYLDAPPLRANARITSGPYRGMITTETRAETLDRLGGDIDRFVAPDDDVFTYFVFPAAHLFLDRPGPSRQLWFLPVELGQQSSVDLVLAPAFADPTERPDVVIENLGVPSRATIGLSVGDRYDEALRVMREQVLGSDYATATANAEWVILRRR